MTHEYTLLVGGVVLPGGGAPEATAIAWAAGTILAIGTDAEIRAISRGDSHVVELSGLVVVPMGARLEVGGPADLQVLHAGGAGEPVAVVHAGRVVEGSLPGLEEHDHPEP